MDDYNYKTIARFKVTSKLFQNFVHVRMLIDELEFLFGLSNVETRTSPGIFKTVVYITIRETFLRKPTKRFVDCWWDKADKSGKNYKIEMLEGDSI